MYGRKYMGMERATFLIGADGRVLKAWRKVKVPGHAEEVLKAARAELTDLNHDLLSTVPPNRREDADELRVQSFEGQYVAGVARVEFGRR